MNFLELFVIKTTNCTRFHGLEKFLSVFSKIYSCQVIWQICTRNHGNHGITYTNSTLNNIFREEHSGRRSTVSLSHSDETRYCIQYWAVKETALWPFDILLILTISIHFDNVYAPILHTISCTRDYTIKLLRNAFLQSRMFRGVQLVSYRRSFFLWSASHCIYCRWYFWGC